MSPASFVAAFEVNFMDDVGQTLLNWASAFGTQEMVKETRVLFRYESVVEFNPDDYYCY